MWKKIISHRNRPWRLQTAPLRRNVSIFGVDHDCDFQPWFSTIRGGLIRPFVSCFFYFYFILFYFHKETKKRLPLTNIAFKISTEGATTPWSLKIFSNSYFLQMLHLKSKPKVLQPLANLYQFLQMLHLRS